MREEYLAYTAEDFALEPTFVDWVKGSLPAASARAWETWLQRHPEKAEEVRKARQLVGALRIRPLDSSGTDVDRLWARIDADTSRHRMAQATGARRRRLLTSLAAAAAIALLLALGWQWLVSSDTQVQTNRAEALAYELPDGSDVRLNAETTLELLSDDWSAQRLVALRGEAYFEVEKGSTFRVVTPRGEVTVLGTTFSVYSRADSFYVHCRSGRVMVSAQSTSDTVVLGAGQACYLNSSGQLRQVEQENIDWLDGLYRFENQPLAVVFAALERQFDLQIEASEAIRQLRYTGFFRNDDQEQALYAVTWPMGLKAERVGNNRIAIRRSEE